jgi:hypothetical protein
MDDSEIQRRVNELDAAVTRDGAKLEIFMDADDGCCHLIGNRKGYLRAGIEMLRAAVVPLNEKQEIIPIDASYLADKKSVSIRSLRRREDFDTARAHSHGPGWQAKFYVLAWLAIFVLILILGFVGFADVMGWLSRKSL